MVVIEAEDRLKLVSTVVADKYAVERALRHDDFVVDYGATQNIVNRPVVLRVLTGLGQVEGHTRSRLYNDFLADQGKLAKLHSRAPALRVIRDAGTVRLPDGDWLPFVVEDYAKGRPLRRALEERKLANTSYTLPDAVQTLDPVAVALGFAHDAGLVHGHVSQDDVWILDDGMALHNFGLPRLAASAREHQAAIPVHVSSPDIAPSPEVVKAGTTPQCDVFALASLLLEMCGTPSPVTNAKASAALARALDPSPAKRYRNAREFWNALRSAMGLSALRSLETTIPPDVLPDSPVRRTRLLILSLTLLLVGIAVGVIGLSYGPRAAQNAPRGGASSGH